MRKKSVRMRFVFLFLLACGLVESSWGIVNQNVIVPHSDDADQREFQNVYQAIANPTINVATISSATISSATITQRLDMTSHKITNLANGTASTDAMAFGQNHFYGVVCSSVTSLDFSTTNATFQTTHVGCTGSLSVSAHHALIVGNGQLTQSAGGQESGLAIFRDAANLDDATNGQCKARTDATGMTLTAINCSLSGYDAVGDISSHTWVVKINASGGSTAHFPNGSTSHFIVLEVD